MTARPIVIALAAALLVAAAPASAERAAPIPAKARKLAEHGRELHERGDYERALAAFREAYVLAPSPGLLFNLAQAHRLHGDCDDAAILYRRYLAASPAEDERALAKHHLATVERCARASELRLASYGIAQPRRRDEIEARDDRLARPGARMQRIGGGVILGGGVLLTGSVYYALFATGDRSAQERAETHAVWLGMAGAAAVTTGITLVLLGKRAERMAPVAVAPVRGGAQVQVAWAF